MSDIREWSTSAAANNAESPDGWKEHMDKSEVNDSGREVMAAIKRWYVDGEWLVLNKAAETVSKDTNTQVRIDDVDLRAYFTVGRRVKLTGGSTVYGFVTAATMSGSDTVVTIDVDPGLGYGELAAGINLTFADADPDTITAASGTPFGSLVDGDRVKVVGSSSNDGTFEVESATSTVITLDSGESLTAEGPVAAEIYHYAGIVPAGTTGIALHIGGALGSAAFRNTGSGTGTVPTKEDLGDHAYEDDGEGDADTVDGHHAADLLVGQNLIVNGDFQRWQEGTSWDATGGGNNDGNYTADQWVLLSDGNDIVDVDKETSGLPSDVEAGITLTWQTADTMAGLYQMVEYLACQAVLGGSGVVSLTFRVKRTAGSSPATLRALVLSWDGTQDACTADWISAWPSAGSNPTPKSNFTIEGSGSLALDGTWQTFTLEDVAIDTSGTKNIGIFIWSDDDTIAASDAITIARVRLVSGEDAIDVEPEPATTLMARTNRYFCSTFSEGTTPAHNTGDGLMVGANGNGYGYLQFCFPDSMLDEPNLAFFNPYSASPGTSYIRRHLTPGDLAVNTSWASTQHAACRPANSGLADEVLSVHIVANARFF